MELNWTIEVILYYIAAAIMSLAFSILIYNYTKKHERHVLYIMLAYIFGAIFLWQEGSAYLLLYMPFLIYAPLWGFVSGYALILGIDSISSERIDPIKMIIWTGLITTVLYFFFQPGSFTEHTFPNGDKSVAFSGVFQYVVNAYEFYPAILYVYYAWKINRLAPPKLKMDSRLFFAGSIVTTLWPAILALTRISLLIPGIHMLGLGLGSLFTAIAFAKQSKLAFILPFKAGRLIVFDLRSGQSLFSYNWQVSIRMSEAGPSRKEEEERRKKGT